MFTIYFGVPELKEFWDDLIERKKNNSLSKDEEKLFKLLGKAVKLLAANPRHPGLNSHEIPPLTKRFGQKVFQSYLENKTPAAGRIFWVYGPNKNEITIIGIEPHPEDKKRGAYERIRLSNLPE